MEDNNIYIKTREHLLVDEINEEKIMQLIQRIREYNYDDDEKEKKEVGFNRNNNGITINLNSYGGSLFAGLALIDAMDYSKTPIRVIATGENCSCAMIIFIAAKYRYATRYSRFMIHEIRRYGWGKELTNVKRNVKESEHNQELIFDLIRERSRFDIDTIKAYAERLEDWYLSLSEASKYLDIIEIKQHARTSN